MSRVNSTAWYGFPAPISSHKATGTNGDAQPRSRPSGGDKGVVLHCYGIRHVTVSDIWYWPAKMLLHDDTVSPSQRKTCLVLSPSPQLCGSASRNLQRQGTHTNPGGGGAMSYDSIEKFVPAIHVDCPSSCHICCFRNIRYLRITTLA